jgi:tetratricopeptide (TPR) repeat protein
MQLILISFLTILLSCSPETKTDIVSKYKTAKNLYIKGEMAESVSVLSEIENSDPDFLPALFLSGKIHYLMNKSETAEIKWKEVLKKNRNHIQAGKWLIRLYISENKNREAEKLLFRIFELSYEDPELMILAGKLSKNSKKYLEAIEYYKKSFLFEDRLIESHLDAAEIYSMFGLKEKSLAHLEKAAEIGGKGHELYKPIKSLIRNIK